MFLSFKYFTRAEIFCIYLDACKRPTASNNMRNRAIYSQISVKIKSLSLFGFPEFCDIPYIFLVYWNSILLKIRNSKLNYKPRFKKNFGENSRKIYFTKNFMDVLSIFGIILVLILVDILLLLHSPLLGSLPLHPPVLEPHLHLKQRELKI